MAHTQTQPQVTISEGYQGDHRNLHQGAIERCLSKLRDTMPHVGLRNPRIGKPDYSWEYCSPFGWVVGFHSGQLWLAAQLSGEPLFVNAARARRKVFRDLLLVRHAQDHDLGMQFSLSCVADWQMTGDEEARRLGLEAANRLLERFRPDGRYIQAWNPHAPSNGMSSDFANGRIIADTMQNLGLLYWAFSETGRADFKDAADGHAESAARYLVRADGTSFHTYLFDPSTATPLRGETFQGYSHESCWSRGQAWLIHGFAQTAQTTGSRAFLDTSRKLAARAEILMTGHVVPPWDFQDPDPAKVIDSSAGAIMAAGLYLLADLCEHGEAVRWQAFADRLIKGLLDTCDLTENPDAHGMLAHGASFVREGYQDNMLPYGDYYFMEALMRSLGHNRFFW